MGREAGSVESSSADFDPAGFVLLLRVSMCPVNRAAFITPFVLAVEFHQCILLNRNSGGEIDVVSDQQSLAGWQSKNKALMSGAIIVVGKQTNDGAFHGNHHTAAMIAECVLRGVRSDEGRSQ